MLMFSVITKEAQKTNRCLFGTNESLEHGTRKAYVMAAVWTDGWLDCLDNAGRTPFKETPTHTPLCPL